MQQKLSELIKRAEDIYEAVMSAEYEDFWEGYTPTALRTSANNLLKDIDEFKEELKRLAHDRGVKKPAQREGAYIRFTYHTVDKFAPNETGVWSYDRYLPVTNKFAEDYERLMSLASDIDRKLIEYRLVE